MYINDYTTSVIASEIGVLKKTGDTEKGGVLFEVDNRQVDPKIWPHDKMYGIYQ